MILGRISLAKTGKKSSLFSETYSSLKGAFTELYFFTYGLLYATSIVGSEYILFFFFLSTKSRVTATLIIAKYLQKVYNFNCFFLRIRLTLLCIVAQNKEYFIFILNHENAGRRHISKDRYLVNSANKGE